MNEQMVLNNLLISYKRVGQGDKALLFLHGWRSQKEVWNKVVSQLSIVNCQLFAIDLPGFGQSPTPKEPWTVGDYAKIVNEFIEKLGLKNVIIVGHSFGGRVGIKLASQYPSTVSKLVLVDSAGFAMSSDKKNLMAVAAKIAKPFFKPKFMQSLRKKIYKQIGAEDYIATPELQKTFVNVTSEDLSSDMQKIACPTLLVWGENDKDTPPDYLEKMRYLIPNTKYQILKNAGHFSFLDQPEEFCNQLNKFID